MTHQFAGSGFTETLELDLHGAFMRRTRLRKVTLVGANLEDADCRGADFSHSNLSGANLRRTNFSGAVLVGTDFKEAVFDQTDIRDADLRGAKNLTADQLTRAIVNDATRLPTTKT